MKLVLAVLALVTTSAGLSAPVAAAAAVRPTMGQWASVLASEGQRGAVCYDAVVVGRQDRYANTEALSDIVGGVWLGTRSDVRIAVTSTLKGGAPPRVVWVRLVETAMHRSGATRLFVLRRIAADHYWAVDWAYRSAEAELLDGLPPSCAGQDAMPVATP